MAEDEGADEKLTGVVDRFPFAMVLTTTFLEGALFLMLNGPLLALFVESATFQDSFSLLGNGVPEKWAAIAALKGDILSVSLFLVLGFAVGLLLTPIDRLFPIVVVGAAEPALNFLRRRFGRPPLKLFTSREFAKSNYVAFLSWLMARRPLKLHWEWELFLYQVAWNVFLSVSVFGVLCVILLDKPTLWEIVAYVVVVVPFALFAMARCLVMASTHSFYVQKFEESMAREVRSQHA